MEFRTPSSIRREYPGGVRLLADGGTWDTIAGQPTDDSEMALALARTLVKRGEYVAEEARGVYVDWLDSDPFDYGATVSNGLRGSPNVQSQANGALMRISPLGIFGATTSLERVAYWAREDAAITHPHPVCQQANALYAMAIAYTIVTGCGAQELYRRIEGWAKEAGAEKPLVEAISGAAIAPPHEYVRQMGWVLIAFGNALWQLLHAPSLEEGVVDTVMRGGDSDTNAAICGALLGAVYGRESIPGQWVDSLLECRPAAGEARVRHPRPECFWPVDAPGLAERLVMRSADTGSR